MDASLNPPNYELLVSSVRLEDDALDVRLIGDFHPESQPQVFRLVARGLKQPQETLAFLTLCQTNAEGVYAFWRDESFCLESEGGTTLCLSATSFEGGPAEYNETELRVVLDRTWAWYKSENLSNQKAHHKIQRLRELLSEQARRIATKSLTHEVDGTAGVLYAQQVQFIERLIREIET